VAYGQGPERDAEQPQARGDGRWQPPEWRYGQRRQAELDEQRRYIGQHRSQPRFVPAQPPLRDQQGRQVPPPYRPQQRHARRPWAVRHKVLVGALCCAGLVIVIAAANAARPPSPASAAGAAAARTKTTAAATLGQQEAAASARTALPKKTQAAASGTSAAPAPARTTATPHAAAAPRRPLSRGPAGCHPLTNARRCYEPGQFCRPGDRNAVGVAGDGERITCEDYDRWRWEPA
jgi:hypothetical protein